MARDLLHAERHVGRRIVDLVADAGDEHAERRQPIGEQEPVLRVALGADVDAAAVGAHHAAVGVDDARDGVAHDDLAPVLAPLLDLAHQAAISGAAEIVRSLERDAAPVAHRVHVVRRIAEHALDRVVDVGAARLGVVREHHDGQGVEELAVDEKERTVEMRLRDLARDGDELRLHRPRAARRAHQRRRRPCRLVEAPAEQPAVGCADEVADRDAHELASVAPEHARRRRVDFLDGPVARQHDRAHRHRLGDGAQASSVGGEQRPVEPIVQHRRDAPEQRQVLFEQHRRALEAEADDRAQRIADRHRHRAGQTGSAERPLYRRGRAQRVATDARLAAAIRFLQLVARDLHPLRPLDRGHADVGRGPAEIEPQVRSVVGDARDAELVDGHDAADLMARRVEPAAIEQRRQPREDALQTLHAANVSRPLRRCRLESNRRRAC